MLLKIFYDIDTDGDGHYVLSFSRSVPDLNEVFEEPELTTISDELESLTFSVAKRHPSLWEDPKSNLMELMAYGLKDTWSEIFNKYNSEIVPVICFDKIGSGINPEEIPSNLIIFTGAPLRNIPVWEQALSLLPKIYFYSSYPWLTTNDHRIARKALKKYAYSCHEKKRQNEKYDTVSRMHHWYKEKTEDLITVAKGCIHEFVIAKKYNHRIDGFLVVPSFHIGRIKKAQRLLLEKYSPQFIMPLPMVHDDKMYTILFPAWCGGKEDNMVYMTPDEYQSLKDMI